MVLNNRTSVKAEAITGAIVVDTPAELCGNAEIIFTMVSNDNALKEILFSQQGIFSTINSHHTLIDCGTTSIELTEEIAKKCAAKKAAFLDAPLTGSKNAADEGTLLFMFGGTKAVFEKNRDVFAALGKKFVHCGQHTNGQRTKIALNIAQVMILESYLEGIALGLKEGIPLNVLREVFDNSGAQNRVSTVKMQKILQRDFSPHFLLELMNKDIKLAQKEMKKLKLDLPLAKAVVKVLQQAVDKGLGKEDFCALVKLLEEKIGIKL